MNKLKKIIAIIIAIIIILYIGYAIYLLIVDPTDSYIIKKGTLSKEDTVTGYIIRDEVIVKEDNQENGIYTIISEGERVAKGEPFFRYYNESEKDTNKQISEINYKIQEILQQEKVDLPSADIKAIENQIEEKIQEIRSLNEYQQISEYKNTIDSLFDKKINVIENVTENQEVKKLVKEKKEYEQKLKNGTEYKTAPISGIVSYKVDGLEDILTTSKFNEINEQYLENIDLGTSQIIATSNNAGKVIDNFKCYIATTMDSNEAMSAKVGQEVQISTSSEQKIKAKIFQINEEGEKRTIIFQTNDIISDLINHRRIEIDIIWWNKSGLKVPNKALIKEDELYYVVKNKAGIQNKILVKVECQTDKFSIISTYSAKDLQEIGFNQQDIKNYKKINNYDEIILQKE